MTVKYVAWVTLNGKGCVYIGCGQILWELKAQTGPEAEAEVGKMVTKSVHREWGDRYKSIIVYEVASVRPIGVDALYRKEEARLAALAVQDIEQKERATYERLKDKYDIT